MQIRSGAYRVPSEPRSIPAERDAGRNQAILSIGDSSARVNKIFTPPPFRSSPSYRREEHSYRIFIIASDLTPVLTAWFVCDRVSSTPSTPELHVAEIIGYATPARVNESLFCCSPLFLLFFERLFKFITRSQRFSPFPLPKLPDECFVSKIDANWS